MNIVSARNAVVSREMFDSNPESLANLNCLLADLTFCREGSIVNYEKIGQTLLTIIQSKEKANQCLVTVDTTNLCSIAQLSQVITEVELNRLSYAQKNYVLHWNDDLDFTESLYEIETQLADGLIIAVKVAAKTYTKSDIFTFLISNYNDTVLSNTNLTTDDKLEQLNYMQSIITKLSQSFKKAYKLTFNPLTYMTKITNLKRQLKSCSTDCSSTLASASKSSLFSGSDSSSESGSTLALRSEGENGEMAKHF